MIKPRILAPAGTEEQLCAAVRCGADEVYMGYGSFNARAGACNISADSLKNAVMYCHERNVRLYVAMNTLIKDSEWENAKSAAADICESGADGVIVQDLGIARLFKSSAPGMPLHASTQMSVHTLEGARLLCSLGFKRVVLAREMSAEEIREIVKSVPIETEIFVHGASCMSVSGQCYFSSVLGGRSGNRGLCAQPCRLPFCAENSVGELTGTGHDLSLKDMSLVRHIGEIAEMGVTSLKIEGRLKRPEYIAAAVTVCRMAADGESIPEGLFEKLEAVFSRSGFTDGYFTSGRGKSMFGYRRKDDVTAATDKVFSSLRLLYKDEKGKIPVNFSLYAHAGSKLSLTLSDGSNLLKQEGTTVEKAENKPSDREKLCEQLCKTGGTPYFANEIKTDVGKDVFVPLSEINLLRRNILSALSKERTKILPACFDCNKDLLPDKHTHCTSPALRACFYNIKNIPANADKCEIVFIPLNSINNRDDIHELLQRVRCLGVSVPRGMFGMEKQIAKLLQKAKEMGISHALVGNLGGLPLAKNAGLIPHCSFGFNSANSRSLEFLKELGVADTEVSFELTGEEISNMKGSLKRGVIVYGKLPLMLTRNCPAANSGVPCSRCSGKGHITDRMGKRFDVICDGVCSQVLNSVPLCVFDKTEIFGGSDFYSLHFTTESKEQAEMAINSFFDRANPFNPATNGLYLRGVM